MDKPAEKFIDKTIAHLQQAIPKEYGEVFSLADELGKHCQSIIETGGPQKHDTRAIALAAIFVRSIQTHRSICMLASSGLVADAIALLRTLLEATAIHINLADNPAFEREYYEADYVTRKKILNQVINSNDPYVKSLFPKDQAEAILKRLDAECPSPKDVNVFDLCQKMKLEGLYVVNHRLFSAETHVSPRSLLRFTNIDPEKGIFNITVKPRVDELIWAAITASIFLCYQLSKMEALYKIDPAQEEDFRKSLEKLKDKYPPPKPTPENIA